MTDPHWPRQSHTRTTMSSLLSKEDNKTSTRSQNKKSLFLKGKGRQDRQAPEQHFRPRSTCVPGSSLPAKDRSSKPKSSTRLCQHPWVPPVLPSWASRLVPQLPCTSISFIKPTENQGQIPAVNGPRVYEVTTQLPHTAADP